jgi:hypothetical protein
MGKRKAPSAVYREWGEIVSGRRSDLVEVRWRLWQDLHAKVFKDDRWIVDIWDAELVAVSGQYLALEMRNWATVELLGLDLLSHVDIQHCNWSGIESCYSLIGVARIMLGRNDDACVTFNSILDTLAIRNKTPLGFLRRCRVVRPICWITDFQPQLEIAPCVRDLLVRELSQIPGRKRLSRQFAQARTYGDLLELREVV